MTKIEKDHLANSEVPPGRVNTWLDETFPERQIYIRSDGRVQFFTFGRWIQATLAFLMLIFLGWVAFATVNVLFTDRLVSARDRVLGTKDFGTLIAADGRLYVAGGGKVYAFTF